MLTNLFGLHKRNYAQGIMKDKLTSRRYRFRYEDAIKYYHLEWSFSQFMITQLRKNRFDRRKPICSEYRLYKLFFNEHKDIRLENTVFDTWYWPSEEDADI